MRAILGISVLWAAAASAAGPPVTVIRGAAVFDPVTGALLPARTVVVEGERIRSVGTEGRGPKGARVIDGRGKFLIPGLIDAHVHLVHVLDFAHVTGDEILPLFVAAGVTSVRDIGDQVAPQKLVARYAEAHPGTCPRVFLCSPLIDRDPPYHRNAGWALTDPAKVPDFVEDMLGWGVKTLKIYVGTEREVGRRVIEEGKRRGLTVGAHLGRYSAQDAVADGVSVLEHIWSVFNYVFPPGDKGAGGSALERRVNVDLENPVAKELIAAIAARGTMVDPTLAVFRDMILLSDLPEIYGSPDNSGVPKRLKDNWDDYRRRSNLKPETLELRRREFRKYQDLTGILFRNRVPLLAGTDTPEPYTPPGLSLHQELELLVESGLTPAAALQAATIQNARALDESDRLGSIEEGKLADLVLLDADPLRDIRNTRRIRMVMRGGIVCDPQEVLRTVPAR